MGGKDNSGTECPRQAGCEHHRSEKRAVDFGKARFPHDNEIKIAIERAEKELGNDGRVLVRVSGTEPLIRVMLEGNDEQKIQVLAEELAEVIKERLL